jgi:subtilase family serine protease
VQILSNRIECTSEFFNAKLNRTEPTFTVRLKNNTSTVVDANNITTAKGLPQAVEGSYTGTNSFNSLGLPPATAADPLVTALKSQLDGLKSEITNLKTLLIDANSVKARLAGENSNLKQGYDALIKALAGVEKERDAAVERKFALLAQITEAVSILRA